MPAGETAQPAADETTVEEKAAEEDIDGMPLMLGAKPDHHPSTVMSRIKVAEMAPTKHREVTTKAAPAPADVTHVTHAGVIVGGQAMSSCLELEELASGGSIAKDDGDDGLGDLAGWLEVGADMTVVQLDARPITIVSTPKKMPNTVGSPGVPNQQTYEFVSYLDLRTFPWWFLVLALLVILAFTCCCLLLVLCIKRRMKHKISAVEREMRVWYTAEGMNEEEKKAPEDSKRGSKSRGFVTQVKTDIEQLMQ